MSLCVQPVAGSQSSLVQGFVSSQGTTACGTGWPPWQKTAGWKPSGSQAAGVCRSVLSLCVQPVAGSQSSSVQAFVSSQLESRPTQLPPTHVSGLLHGLPSMHTSPSSTGDQLVGSTATRHARQGCPGFEASGRTQAPSMKHHCSAGGWRQVPLSLQTSSVQEWPSSSHGAPANTGSDTQPSSGALSRQTSMVHSLPSEHSFSAPWHTPASLQASPTVHMLESSHGVPAARSVQADVLHSLSHQRQSSIGSTASIGSISFDTTQTPSIKHQPLASAEAQPPDPSGTATVHSSPSGGHAYGVPAQLD